MSKDTPQNSKNIFQNNNINDSNLHVGDIIVSIHNVQENLKTENLISLLEDLKSTIKDNNIMLNKKQLDGLIDNITFHNEELERLNQKKLKLNRELKNYVLKDINTLTGDKEENVSYIWRNKLDKDKFWLIELPNDEKNKLNLDRLEEALKKQDFQEADMETSNILKNYLNQLQNRNRDWISFKEIYLIPIELLYEIDQLWMYYSDGHFGITPQYELWKKYKGNFKEFTINIGWFQRDEGLSDNYNDFTFSLNVNKGHLPTFQTVILSGQGKINNWSRFYLGLINKIDNFFNNSLVHK